MIPLTLVLRGTPFQVPWNVTALTIVPMGLMNKTAWLRRNPTFAPKDIPFLSSWNAMEHPNVPTALMSQGVPKQSVNQQKQVYTSANMQIR